MRLRNKKTGEVEKAYITMNGDKIAVIVADMPLCGNSVLGEYDSLAELNEEWEDYEPTEPFIKDEKIRKAVRIWAEINSTEEVIYSVGMDRSACNLIDTGDDDFVIEFVGLIPTLKEGMIYTIAELCGEEEE